MRWWSNESGLRGDREHKEQQSLGDLLSGGLGFGSRCSDLCWIKRRIWSSGKWWRHTPHVRKSGYTAGTGTSKSGYTAGTGTSKSGYTAGTGTSKSGYTGTWKLSNITYTKHKRLGLNKMLYTGMQALPMHQFSRPDRLWSVATPWPLVLTCTCKI